MEEFNPEFKSDPVGMVLGSPIPSQPIDRKTVTSAEEEMGGKKESLHKHIVIYVNGDRSSVGTYLLLDCSRYHELDDLLRDLTYTLPKHVYLPCGVQRIFTPTGRHRVRSLSDLKDGLSYVCTGFEPLKHLNYGAKDSRVIESADPPLGELLKTVTYAKNEHNIKLSEAAGSRPPGHVAGDGQRDSGFVDAGATPERDDLATFPRSKHGEERFPQIMDRMPGDDIRIGQPPFLENKERRSKGRNNDFLLSSKCAPSVPLHRNEKFRPIYAHSTSPAASRRNLPSLHANQMGVRISSTSQVAFRAINLEPVQNRSPAFPGIKNSADRNAPSCLSGQRASNNLQYSATPIRPIIDRVFRHERSRPSLRTSPHPSSELSAQNGEKPFLRRINRRSRPNGKRALGNFSSEELHRSKKGHEIDEKLNNALVSTENVQENTVKIYHEEVLANQQDAVGTGSVELHTDNLAKGDTVPDVNSHVVIQKSVDMVEKSGAVYKKGKLKDKNTKTAHDAFKPVEPKTQQSPQKAAHNAVKLVGLAHLNLKFVPDSENLRNRYHIGRILGDGNFAVVRLVRRRDTGQKYAMKIIDKAKLRGKEMMLHQEITILHSCSHPNIVRLLEEYETPKEIWLVMELVKDGDLFEGITNSVKYSENVASGIVADIANALFYLHCRYIVHRDLKPENVLMWHQPDGKLRVKLADFGLAVEVRRNLYTVCGTPTYIAPEILSERGYGLEVDLWALGIITYIMLCGFAPFRSPDRRQSQLFESIKRGVFVFLSPYWDEISQGAKDLVNRLLVVTPRKRLTAIETLTHPWVYFEGSSDNSESSGKLEKSREEYKRELEKEAQNIKSRKLSTENSNGVSASMSISSTSGESKGFERNTRPDNGPPSRLSSK
ncbi:serine/threonine-protein kinase DCLK3 [Clonorchis sinensis]|uniref:non-specific serine/threonine protein kinase n=1 Tax=Clonorchis sinensis TaxID=79923 RepID=G7Y9T0_CLOSI|nr:serine/threonine-protein kinase DCLK3 [Clonorchis sinensis]